MARRESVASGLGQGKGEEAKRRQAETTRRRLATRARNAQDRPPKVPAPRNGKPPAFYVSPELDPAWFPDEHHWWCAGYFVNLIHWRSCCWRANEEHFVPLLYRYLERVVPRPVLKSVRQTLADRAVVECDGVALRGRKAFGYRLTPPYRRTHRLVCTDDRLNRRIWAVYGAEEGGLLPVHRWLKGKLDVLEFDMDRAGEIIGRMRPDSGSKLSRGEYRLLRTDHALRLAHKDHWCSRDRFGRVHTPVTALEKELHCCLSADGQPLIETDLANSQPLFLGILAKDWLTASKASQARITRREFTDSGNSYHAVNQSITHNSTINPPTTHTHQPTPINNVNRSLNRCNDRELGDLRSVTLPADLAEYVDVCERAKFYESLMTEKEKARGDKYRQRFKQRFYGVLFGGNVSRGRFPNKLRLRFRRRYPSMAGVLRALKRKEFRHSSHVLQNYEATLFIHRICGRIMKERPDTVVYTIHDSILTTPDAAAYVRGVILDEFKKLGVTPTLKPHSTRKDVR